MKITQRTVNDAKSTSGRPTGDILWDAELRGFGLQVLPSGTKTFVLNYRHEGKERRISLGRADSLTAEAARKMATEHKHAIAHGADPVRQRRAARDALTVNQLLDAYLASDKFKEKTPVTQSVDRGRIERHLRPLLGKQLAHQVTHRDVQKALVAIREGKTATNVKTGFRGRAVVRGGEGAARMAIIVLSVIFNWAIREEIDAKLTANPCKKVQVGAHGQRDTILEDEADYRRVFDTLTQMEEERRIRSEAADAIRLIALTGMRRGEASGLRWRHVQGARVVLTAKEHKAGHATGRARIITLPAAAQEIIGRQERRGDDDLVFAPSKGEGAIELSHLWSKVRAEAQLDPKLTLHGLRHSTASHMAMGGAETAQIMTQLGHSQASTVARYIHFAKSAREALAEQAASVALAGMTSKVVRLRKRG